KYCSWACPYGVREFDSHEGVMKKCTLCVDRINNQNLPEAERKPACVLACPTGARTFGDIDDPQSAASIAIKEKQGHKIMPEAGTDPSNHYLPQKKAKIILDEEELHVKPLAIVAVEKKVTSYKEQIIDDFVSP
ncbi:MAG: ferredoxin, partial [Nitrospirales bacterium]|nr:ferredoxin [Nitrospirales bacterium]